MKIIPEKLKQGDEIRIIAPSLSLKIIPNENIDQSIKTLQSLGLKISFGKNTEEIDMMSSSSIQSRVDDLHSAFEDKKIKAILSIIGGFNANQLLPYIDYTLIKNNPKIFCGYSDITALQNAIFSKTGLITYSGPHFSTFAMEQGLEYTLDYFKKIFFTEENIVVTPSNQWSDDAWFLDQKNRNFRHNEGYWVLNEGEAKGTIVGGNLSTLQLLHGTPYMPSLDGAVLFIESDSITDGKYDIEEFDRQFQSLIQQKDFNKVKGLVIGRFENKFNMTKEKLSFIVHGKKELNNIPVVANVDFGHTSPMVTIPVGGMCEVGALDRKINFIISEKTR